MDNELAALAAVVVASAGAVIAAVRKEAVAGLIAAAVALFALADVVKGL